MESDSQQDAGIDVETLDTASQEYLGRWHSLVSTTNWEKGGIIAEWRKALQDSGAAVQQYSDEAWSRRVGHVSGQHAGRLRRVFERFDAVRSTYQGLYWSHFCAASDWDDAELWLEGAVQNNWSISDMRTQRAEAFGQTASSDAGDDPSAEFDEDFAPIEAGDQAQVRLPGEHESNGAVPFGAHDDAADDSNDAESDQDSGTEPWDFAGREGATDDSMSPAAHAIPLTLPNDLAEAFDGLKLAILRHKLNGWQEASREDVLSGLSALVALANSASE